MSRISRIKWGKPALFAGVLAMVPSIGMAFSTGFDSQPVSLDAIGGIGSFTPASVDPDLATNLKFEALNGNKLFRFTPADGRVESDRPRALTIAVRVDPERAEAIGIRSSTEGAPGKGLPTVKITPTAYSLGVAKGFQKFAQKLDIAEQKPQTDPVIPDLSEIGKPGRQSDKSRFSADVELDAVDRLGTSPRTFGGQGDYSVGVQGSYRISRNLDVTAGIRYRSERDRLDPLTSDQQDSQAVYVGTQFKF